MSLTKLKQRYWQSYLPSRGSLPFLASCSCLPSRDHGLFPLSSEHTCQPRFCCYASFFFFFWLCCMACGIWVCGPGIKPRPRQWKRQVLTSRPPRYFLHLLSWLLPLSLSFKDTYTYIRPIQIIQDNFPISKLLTITSHENTLWSYIFTKAKD